MNLSGIRHITNFNSRARKFHEVHEGLVDTKLSLHEPAIKSLWCIQFYLHNLFLIAKSSRREPVLSSKSQRKITVKKFLVYCIYKICGCSKRGMLLITCVSYCYFYKVGREVKIMFNINETCTCILIIYRHCDTVHCSF